MKTLVIGAGISGLITARELARAGRRAVVVEARSRLGGRIMTRSSRAPAFAVDLGPEFVHGNPQETRDLAGDSSRDIIRLEPRQRIFWRGRIQEYDVERNEQIFETLGERAPDRSVALALGELDLDEKTAAMATAFAEGFNAAVATELSVNAIVQENRRVEDDLLDNHRLLPGYHSLVVKIAEDLDPQTIRLDQTVRELRWRRGHVVARVAREDGEYEEEFGCVVYTVPTSCFEDIHVSPAIPAHVEAARQLPMGDVQKIVLTFKEPLWDRPANVGIDFVHSPELTFNTRWVWGWTDRFTLTSWAGGGRARKLRGLSEAELVDLALEELALVVNRPVTEVRALVDQVFHHDWSLDPHSRGAYSYPLVGGENARQTLGRPIEGTLFFAGEATDFNGAAGTVHGAIRSGLRVAKEVLAETSDH